MHAVMSMLQRKNIVNFSLGIKKDFDIVKRFSKQGNAKNLIAYGQE